MWDLLLDFCRSCRWSRGCGCARTLPFNRRTWGEKTVGVVNGCHNYKYRKWSIRERGRNTSHCSLNFIPPHDLHSPEKLGQTNASRRRKNQQTRNVALPPMVQTKRAMRWACPFFALQTLPVVYASRWIQSTLRPQLPHLPVPLLQSIPFPLRQSIHHILKLQRRRLDISLRSNIRSLPFLWAHPHLGLFYCLRTNLALHSLTGLGCASSWRRLRWKNWTAWRPYVNLICGICYDLLFYWPMFTVHAFFWCWDLQKRYGRPHLQLGMPLFIWESHSCSIARINQRGAHTNRSQSHVQRHFGSSWDYIPVD